MVRNYAYARVRRRKKGRVGKKIFNRAINRRVMSDYRVRSDRNGVIYARARKVEAENRGFDFSFRFENHSAVVVSAFFDKPVGYFHRRVSE